MEQIKKVGKGIYKLYMGLGIFSVGLLASCVIYAVIMRYFFNISYTFLEEFMTTLFAFTTFWGIGICIMEDEHVIINSIYELFPTKVKKSVTFLNYIVVLLVNVVMVKYGLDYAIKYGAQISMGMRIPMIFMYGIIPLGSFIATICTCIKLVTIVKAPLDFFKSK
jgi:TRAP-type C4-dicarboxylate transport system permease small subunit